METPKWRALISKLRWFLRGKSPNKWGKFISNERPVKKKKWDLINQNGGNDHFSFQVPGTKLGSFGLVSAVNLACSAPRYPNSYGKHHLLGGRNYDCTTKQYCSFCWPSGKQAWQFKIHRLWSCSLIFPLKPHEKIRCSIAMLDYRRVILTPKIYGE